MVVKGKKSSKKNANESKIYIVQGLLEIFGFKYFGQGINKEEIISS